MYDHLNVIPLQITKSYCCNVPINLSSDLYLNFIENIRICVVEKMNLDPRKMKIWSKFCFATGEHTTFYIVILTNSLDAFSC